MNEHEPMRGAQWIHLALLVALVAVLQIGRMIVDTDNVLTLPVFARALYTWLPSLAGVAISITGPHRRISRSATTLGLIVIAMMIALDVLGGTRPVLNERGTALIPGDAIGRLAEASQLVSVSWVRTLIDWANGSLGVVAETRLGYGTSDARFKAAQAVTESGLLLIVFASMGFVIAAMSWVRIHVVFKRGQDRKGFFVVLGWLVAPLVAALSRQFVVQERFLVLFRGAPLWLPLLPSVACLGLGLLAWWYTARYREPEA